MKRAVIASWLVGAAALVVLCGSSVKSQYDARVASCQGAEGELLVRCHDAHPIEEEPASCSVFWACEGGDCAHSDAAARREETWERIRPGKPIPRVGEQWRRDATVPSDEARGLGTMRVVAVSVACEWRELREARERKRRAEQAAARREASRQRAAAQQAARAAAERQLVELQLEDATVAMRRFESATEEVRRICAREWSDTHATCERGFQDAASAALAVSVARRPRTWTLVREDDTVGSLADRLGATCLESCRAGLRSAYHGTVNECRANYVASGGKQRSCVASAGVGADHPILIRCHADCSEQGKEQLAEEKARIEDEKAQEREAKQAAAVGRSYRICMVRAWRAIPSLLAQEHSLRREYFEAAKQRCERQSGCGRNRHADCSSQYDPGDSY
ncbi:MAG: hypothetical protein IT376_21590 [Polyangiaceae bacterium]|nr:hypothetical protein [Polyangiaceae bacterium]